MFLMSNKIIVSDKDVQKNIQHIKTQVIILKESIKRATRLKEPKICKFLENFDWA